MMHPQPQRPYRRRHWIVEPAYQLKVTSVMLTLFLVFVLVTLSLVYYALWSTLRVLELGQEALFVAVFQAVAWMITVELVLAIPVIVVLGILLTHKVVGPLARIKAAIDQLGQGHFDIQLKLRKGDVLTDLAESINRLAAALRGHRP